ncbi:MAG TPA: hypothetical protein VH413_14575 [Verrucomicrobiae bacterium]|jgi:rRNA-processing protein FCF1|nr:hypothetical protein [Verrucomicrobiae bacterium]
MSADYSEILENIFGKHRKQAILLDTNILMLYLVGLTNRSLIQRFKPISNQRFSESDFDLLCEIISRFKNLITTPHILTEVSNHSDKLKGKDRWKFCNVIRLFITESDEHYSPSKELSQQEYFPEFGLTDTAISKVAAGKFFVLTTDFKLAALLGKRNIDVRNFTQLRLLSL